MAIINGTDLQMYSTAGSGVGTSYLVAFAQNCSLNINHSARDITNKESAGFKQISESLRDWTIDIDGAYAYTDINNKALLNGADDLTSKIGLTSIAGGSVNAISLANEGSGYGSQTTNVPTTGGTGNGLLVNITISGGEVQTVGVSSSTGTGYTIGDVITITTGDNNATFTISSLLSPVTTTNLRIPFQVRFGGLTTGSANDVSYYGNVFLTALSFTGGTEDTATYSISLEGDGDLTQIISP